MLIQGAQLHEGKVKELERASHSLSDIYLHFISPSCWETVDVSGVQRCSGGAQQGHRQDLAHPSLAILLQTERLLLKIEEF